MEIYITEHFDSIQGEGKWTGTPSTFIRSYGCNLTCAGFGQDRKSKLSIDKMPHNTFDVSTINFIDELPVFDIGCDSSAAWNKKYKHLSIKYTPQDLLEECSKAQYHLVITGGEPLLPKYQLFWLELLTIGHWKHVTFETNGTQELKREFEWGLLDLCKQRGLDVTFSVSPKLSISGEEKCVSIKPRAVQSYVDMMNAPCAKGEVYLKYVIRDDQDIQEVKSATQDYGFLGDVYLMPEGATLNGVMLTERNVADLCLKYNYKFSPRLHIALYGNGWGT